MFRGKITLLILVAAVLSLAGPDTLAQAAPDAQQRRKAAQELENILSEAPAVSDKLASVKVRAKAANLLWLSDPERAGKAFASLWAWVDTQGGDDFDREAARTVIVKRLMPRDRMAALELLKEIQAEGAGEAGITSPGVRRLNDLASELIETDPGAAAGFINRSLEAGASPVNAELLARLRKRDDAAADRLVSGLLRSMAVRPTSDGLALTFYLVDYLFPTAASAAAPTRADDLLRRQFFFASYDLLRRALGESEPPVPNAGFNPVTLVQSQLAAVLSVMAGRYAPERAAELERLAAKLSAGVPPQFSDLVRLTLDRVRGRPYQPKAESAEAAFSSALSGGDYGEARRALGRFENEVARKIFAEQVDLAEFKARLGAGELEQAALVARGVEDGYVKARMYTQVSKAAAAKGDARLAGTFLAEARAALSGEGCGERKALGLLFLASAAPPVSAEEAVELLHSAKNCINSAGARGGNRAARGGAAGFADSPELEQAFSAAGRVDLDGALLAAIGITDKPASLMARLAACETWLKAPEKKDSKERR